MNFKEAVKQFDNFNGMDWLDRHCRLQIKWVLMLCFDCGVTAFMFTFLIIAILATNHLINSTDFATSQDKFESIISCAIGIGASFFLFIFTVIDIPKDSNRLHIAVYLDHHVKKKTIDKTKAIEIEKDLVFNFQSFNRFLKEYEQSKDVPP